MIKTYATGELDRLRAEVRGLCAAEQAGIRAPHILNVSEAELSLEMTRLPGAPVVNPGLHVTAWVDGLAAQLRVIAEANRPTIEVPVAQSWQESVQDRPDWVDDVGLWRAVQDRVAAGFTSSSVRFIHRDFHPLNVLWSAGEVSGVVDWEHACVGPLEYDISKSRVNIAAVIDLEAADAFLAACGHHGHGYDLAWDLETIVSLLGNVDILTKGNEVDGTLTAAKVRATFVEMLRNAVS